MQCTIQTKKKQHSINRLCLVFCNDLPVYCCRRIAWQLIPLPLSSHVLLSWLVHQYCVETATSHMNTQEAQRSVGVYFLDDLQPAWQVLKGEGGIWARKST